MQSIFRIFLMGFLVLGLGACAPATPAPSTTGYYSLAIRTGNPAIDPVLEAVAQRDARELHAVIQFTEANCTQNDGLGGPPRCRPGENEGSAVRVLPMLGPEGAFLRQDEIQNWQGIDVTGLYAIYQVSPDVPQEPYYPAGEYAIQLLGSDTQAPVVLRTQAGKIVRVDYVFDNAPREALAAWIQREASSIILPPPAP